MMKVLTLLVPAFFYAFYAHAQDTLPAFKTYQNAQISFQKAEYNQAEILFGQASSQYAGHINRQVDCKLQIVKSIIRQGKLAEASEAIERITIPQNSLLLPAFENIAGELQLNRGRNDLALKAFEKALQGANDQNQPIEQAQSYANLGLVYWNTGNQELAMEYQQKALTIRQANLPTMHPDIAASYNDFGLIYSTTDAIQAREYYTKAFEIYKKIYGEKHPKIAIAYTNLAITYKAEKKYEEALTQLENAAKIWEDMYGKQHPNTGLRL